MNAPCPFCGLSGGFHDVDEPTSKHRQIEVPKHLLRPLASERKAEKLATLANGFARTRKSLIEAGLSEPAR